MFVELTNAALSLLNLLKTPDESVQELIEEVHFAPQKTLQILEIKDVGGVRTKVKIQFGHQK